MSEIDISTEEYRTYTYAPFGTYTIRNPVKLFVMPSDGTEDGSHRVIDADGVTHRPAKGWVGLSWKAKPDAPAFVA
ncbi:hypothetical protein HNO88_000328 [Novosphingobium chloroacetimidivorans]|uniref:Uncharacterized protein n=1 Tax=Novosphingobium chloroacetimidivorans TaxID=1428314 RepID=A0A7W7NUB2_9SPHN|nr:hypothetical protein [Novosphingobium chloroacetimidivorans]MBB4857031.1 hypothetical protein [Novosphingobium chloroacetimidivorans]